MSEAQIALPLNKIIYLHSSIQDTFLSTPTCFCSAQTYEVEGKCCCWFKRKKWGASVGIARQHWLHQSDVLFGARASGSSSAPANHTTKNCSFGKELMQKTAMSLTRTIQGQVVQALCAQDWEGAAKLINLALCEAAPHPGRTPRTETTTPVDPVPSITAGRSGDGIATPCTNRLSIVPVAPRGPGSFVCLDPLTLHPYAFAFLVQRFTVSDEDGAFANFSVAIMLYNLALTYHLQGIQSRQLSCLMKALKMYKLTWSTITKHVNVNGKNALRAHHLMALAAVYNMGQISAMIGFPTGVAGCAAHIQCILKRCCHPGTMDPNYSSEWSEQVRFFATSLIYFSCWCGHHTASAA
jgi:hypothetical protein